MSHVILKKTRYRQYEQLDLTDTEEELQLREHLSNLLDIQLQNQLTEFEVLILNIWRHNNCSIAAIAEFTAKNRSSIFRAIKRALKKLAAQRGQL